MSVLSAILTFISCTNLLKHFALWLEINNISMKVVTQLSNFPTLIEIIQFKGNDSVFDHLQ